MEGGGRGMLRGSGQQLLQKRVVMLAGSTTVLLCTPSALGAVMLVLATLHGCCEDATS